MSDKDEKSGAQPRPPAPRVSDGGLRQMFAPKPGVAREGLPTEAEGDALLDMLFDDAPPASRGESPSDPLVAGADRPTPVPEPESGPKVPRAPLAKPEHEEEQPTRLHSADEMQALIESVRTPPAGVAAAPRPMAPRPPPTRPQPPAAPLSGRGLGGPPPLPGALRPAVPGAPPRPPPLPPGEVVAPPGWKISPSPPAARASTAPVPPVASAPPIPLAEGDLEYASAPPPDYDDDDDDLDEPATLFRSSAPRLSTPAAQDGRSSRPDPRVEPEESPTQTAFRHRSQHPTVPEDVDGMPVSVEDALEGAPAPHVSGTPTAAPPAPPPPAAYANEDDRTFADLRSPTELLGGSPRDFGDGGLGHDDDPEASVSDEEGGHSVDAFDPFADDPVAQSDAANDDPFHDNRALAAGLGDDEPAESYTEVAELPPVHDSLGENAGSQGDPASDEPAPSQRASVRPRKMFSSRQAASFDEEREASIVLAEQPGLRESFIDRARWLREEASLMTDRAAQSRTLLVVSELFAMAGEDDEAAAVAFDAHQLAPSSPLAIRQHRALLARGGNWASALDVMDAEVRVMPTPESKCHAAWFGAEVARFALGDEASAKKRAEVALRAMPGDPRAHVQRFAEALIGTPEPMQLARLRPVEGEAAAVLADAFGSVAGHRGGVRPGEKREGYDAILAARAAIKSGEIGSAAAAIGALETTVLASGAGWLGGLLSSATPDTRPQAAAALAVASRGAHHDLAARALAGVRIETGQAEGADDSTASFGEADRIAIASLSNAEGALARIDAETTASDPELEVLKSASRAALLGAGSDRAARIDAAGIDAASVSLGRSLASVVSREGRTPRIAETTVPAKLASAFEHLESQGRSSASLRPLAVEVDLDSGNAERVAEALSQWSAGDAGDASASLATALIHEVAGRDEDASAAYDKVLEAGHSHESVLRARAAREESVATARMLRGFAEQLAPGTRRAALLTECGIRLAREEDPAEAIACFRGAADADAKLPASIYAGERLARAAGDQDGLIEWLHIRREASEDAIERAHDLTREALLVSDGETPQAGELLEEALRARPTDFGLRDLYERLAVDQPKDRAAWREARANDATGAEAARLGIEAAIEHEQAGDLEAASRATRIAEAAGDTELAPIFAYRFALAGHGTAEFVDALLPKAREAQEPSVRLEIYERLAELDERGRGDASSGLLFRRTILEENPSHLRTLRRVASTLMAQDREDELEPIAFELAKTLDGPEAHAYAALSSRLRLRGKWEDTLESVAIAYAQEPRSTWSLRQMAAHARARGDSDLAARCDQELIGRTERPAEKATLAIRAAESFSSAGQVDAARELYEGAIAAVPHHPVARLGFALLLERAGDFKAAAEQLESAANAMNTPGWKSETAYRAGVLLQDQVGDVERAREAFEHVFELDPRNDDVFARLRKIYVEAQARGELASLLERRLDSVSDPGERVEMEVMRGRALAEVGDAGAAKRALLAALEANPDHSDALSAFAELCLADEDFEGAEQALIRLARLTSDVDQQAGIYMRLGDLYDEHLPNPERAEVSYQEILKRRPNDVGAREKLVALLKRTASYPRAVEEQNHLVTGAATPDEKCQRTVELAEILEEMGELKKAENTLVAARKTYPKSDLALRSLVRFYQRTSQGSSAAVLLDRAVADARRALSTGRFEPYLFETLFSAADLRGRADAAKVAQATVMALEGQPNDLSGAGPRAGDAKLDELLAPDVMTPAFRELLLKTGPMLDQAVPFNFEAIRATPIPPNANTLGEEVRSLSGAYGLPQINILVSTVLGPVCIAATAHPPTIVFGQALATAGASAARTFLIHRALKVIQANAAAFARTAPIDLWPLLAAYLKVMSPSFVPQGVDAGKLNEAHSRLSRTLPQGTASDVGLLAADVIGAIGNRASTLNTAVNGWGARAGLLAVADPNVALSAIALASGAMNGPPAEGKDRVTWVGRNAEARDLIVFSVSDHYSDARSRLGLT